MTSSNTHHLADTKKIGIHMKFWFLAHVWKLWHTYEIIQHALCSSCKKKKNLAHILEYTYEVIQLTSPRTHKYTWNHIAHTHMNAFFSSTHMKWFNTHQLAHTHTHMKSYGTHTHERVLNEHTYEMIQHTSTRTHTNTHTFSHIAHTQSSSSTHMKWSNTHQLAHTHSHTHEII